MNAANTERFKISKRAAGYQDFPSPGRSCKVCGRFRGDRCHAVQGWIYEDGYRAAGPRSRPCPIWPVDHW